MDTKEFNFYYKDIDKDKKKFVDEYEVVLKNGEQFYRFCSNNCEHLDVNEREQNLYRLKCSHNCKKYNKELYHLQFHPLLLKCEECNDQD